VTLIDQKKNWKSNKIISEIYRAIFIFRFFQIKNQKAHKNKNKNKIQKICLFENNFYLV
jgi:hypothetical protein